MGNESRQINVLVDKEEFEEVKEEYPYGTVSEEVQNLISHLADFDGDEKYDPDASVVDYEEHIEGGRYPDDWAQRRKDVFRRDDYQCQNCKDHGSADGPAVLHAHHIVPVDSGGTNYMSNLVTLCRRCHDSAH